MNTSVELAQDKVVNVVGGAEVAAIAEKKAYCRCWKSKTVCMHVFMYLCMFVCMHFICII